MSQEVAGRGTFREGEFGEKRLLNQTLVEIH